jgi:hypothetical protein
MITTILVQNLVFALTSFPFCSYTGLKFCCLVIRNCFVNFYCLSLLVCFFARFKLLNKVTYLSVLKIHEVNGRGDFLCLTAMELCTTMGIKENRYAIWLSELAREHIQSLALRCQEFLFFACMSRQICVYIYNLCTVLYLAYLFDSVRHIYLFIFIIYPISSSFCSILILLFIT